MRNQTYKDKTITIEFRYRKKGNKFNYRINSNLVNIILI